MINRVFNGCTMVLKYYDGNDDCWIATAISGYVTKAFVGYDAEGQARHEAERIDNLIAEQKVVPEALLALPAELQIKGSEFIILKFTNPTHRTNFFGLKNLTIDPSHSNPLSKEFFKDNEIARTYIKNLISIKTTDASIKKI